MSSSPFLTPNYVQRARTIVQQRVGAFFRNTRWIHLRTCYVCAGPVQGYETCWRCKTDYGQWGSQLADIVMILAYAYCRSYEHRVVSGKHQSEQHMWSYKEPNPGPGCVVDLTTMLLVALQWHRGCVEKVVGRPWGAWCVVPSSKRKRPGPHPLIALGEAAGLGSPQANLDFPRVNLVLQGDASDDRDVRADRFAVENPAAVRGLHVLLLEDTWVTGGSVQSAAVALKQAGASAVTILCLARWIREDRLDTAEFFKSLQDPFDPLMCPVGPDCVGPKLPV